MPWGVAVAAVVGAVAQDRASDKAADAAKGGANASIAEQRAARQWYEQNASPYIDAGSDALMQLRRLNAGDMSSFYETPDYVVARDQGLRGLDRSLAARGGLNAGGADADRMAFASNLATQNYGQYYNRLANLASMGQNAVAQTGTGIQNTASNIGNALMSGANAQAAGYINSANAYSNALGQLGGAYGQYMGGRQSAYQQPQQVQRQQVQTWQPQINIGG